MIGIVAMQFTAGLIRPEKQRPGTERNDLVLRQEDLPPDIHGWKLSSFEAAKPVEQLTEVQFWWTHSWNYAKTGCSSIVAFDQLGLHQWHELTVCYEANGWQIESRKIVTNSDHGAPWDYVVAQMSNTGGEFALVVFSVFWGDGQPMDAPYDPAVISFSGRENNLDKGIWNRMTNRLTEQTKSSSLEAGLENRGLQCQMFLVSAEPLDQDRILDAIQLHLTTRQEFRSVWLRHAKSNVAN